LALLTLRNYESLIYKKILDNVLSYRSSHFSISIGVTFILEYFFIFLETIFQRLLPTRINLILNMEMCQFSPSNFNIMHFLWPFSNEIIKNRKIIEEYRRWVCRNMDYVEGNSKLWRNLDIYRNSKIYSKSRTEIWMLVGLCHHCSQKNSISNL